MSLKHIRPSPATAAIDDGTQSREVVLVNFTGSIHHLKAVVDVGIAKTPLGSVADQIAKPHR